MTASPHAHTLFEAIALTLFPEMFPGPLAYSLAGKALHNGLWNLETLNIRDYATNKHNNVDDTPYGGGTGMVMRADVVDAAICAAKSKLPNARLIHFTPRGQAITQPLIAKLVEQPLIMLCGRFEGIDERIFEEHQPLDLSLGEFVLSGGEIPALALLDACLRLVPGVIQDESALGEESFGLDAVYAGLLEYPHYTRPPVWKGKGIPDVLLSGHHEQIRTWRLAEAERVTATRRPDMWERYMNAKK
ncbi:MAG: tRNA (guanosine(37)-N1)-methyltransferase TrmD [Alphaproteobacteria bacterium]|nr:tRNA (guanosine(37)-N1)-methyltransferase TrmD [Alphaproteobacteria bacterium]